MSDMTNIVTKIICSTFETEVKRNQSKNKRKFGMLVSFNLELDFEKEEGNRNLDILIYSPSNYVGVIAKESWSVIKNEEIEGEFGLKPGCDYRIGDTGWMYACYHDTCWRTDGVEKIVYSNSRRIAFITSNVYPNWYEKIEMTPELLVKFEETTSRANFGKEDRFYSAGKNVFKF
jgi:hypothetical protein